MGTEALQAIRLTGEDWRVLREVRLAALADAPHAYGSSLAIEQAFDEAKWRSRLAHGVWVLATDGDETAGLAGAFPLSDDTPMLVAMWVLPAHRGRGAGDLLVTEILRWAKENRRSAVALRVADGNAAARTLFLRHGFVPTGGRESRESDPEVSTELLSRVV